MRQFIRYRGQLYRLASEQISEERKRQLFDRLARLQREAPESAFRAVAHFYGGKGLLATSLEETGDLINRMTELGTWESAGYENVLPKVKLMLNRLRRGWVPYEMEEQIVAVAKESGMGLEEFNRKLKTLLNNYVEAHKWLPTYNRAQGNANRAAIDLGAGKYERCQLWLENLERHLASRDEWVAFAHQYDPYERLDD